MTEQAHSVPGFREVPVLLRGEAASIQRWIECPETKQVSVHIALIVAGSGLFGLAMGWWRDPLQGFYTALKLPTIVLLTTLGNALLNGMLAPLLGLPLSFRQSFMVITMSFAIAAAILGAFSPILLFLAWNTPSIGPDGRADIAAYDFLLLAQVATIALAGVAAHLRLLQWLRGVGGSMTVALKVLAAWLAGNLLLGSQLSWILRPFVGSPQLPVQFLRTDAFQGNFYEAVCRALCHLF